MSNEQRVKAEIKQRALFVGSLRQRGFKGRERAGIKSPPCKRAQGDLFIAPRLSK